MLNEWLPLMFNANFPIYANFMTFDFKGLAFGMFFIYYLNMFFMIRINVKVFLVHAPLVKKGCKGFKGYIFFIYNIIYNELLFIIFFFHIC